MLLADGVVLGNGDWEPYLSPNLKHGGFASHVVTEAFNKMGIEVEYEWFGDAWKRAYLEAVNDKIDGTLVWSHTPEREKEFYYSENDIISGVTTFLYFLKTDPLEWDGTVKSLKGEKIGGHIGYTYGETIDKAISSKELDVQMISNDVNNFKKLLTGRINGIMINEEVADEILLTELSEDEKNQITYSEIPIRKITYHLLLNRKDPKNVERIKLFDQGFNILKENGILSEMIKQFENGWYKPEE
jgi:polar amino acid transport system substrate-binding protein